MVLIEAQGPQSVALGILLSFQLDFVLGLPYFRFRSVRPKLQAGSGRLGEAVRATQHHQRWHYIVATADIIGAALHPVLLGKTGNAHRGHRQKGGNQQRQLEVFADFFIFAVLRLLAEYKSHSQQYQRSTREREEKGMGRIGKARTPINRASPIVIEIAY